MDIRVENLDEPADEVPSAPPLVREQTVQNEEPPEEVLEEPPEEPPEEQHDDVVAQSAPEPEPIPKRRGRPTGVAKPKAEPMPGGRPRKVTVVDVSAPQPVYEPPPPPTAEQLHGYFNPPLASLCGESPNESAAGEETALPRTLFLTSMAR